MRFVNVTWDLYWDRVQIDYDAWDTHTKNFSILQENKLPTFDQTFSRPDGGLAGARLARRDAGGRHERDGPHPEASTAAAGRDHWTYCYGAMLAGAGIKGGAVLRRFRRAGRLRQGSAR